MSGPKRLASLAAVLIALAAAFGIGAGSDGPSLVRSAEAAFPGPDNLAVSSQQCLANGRVRVNYSWTAYSTGAQWIDLSLANNGFSPNTFIGLGPLPANQAQFTWDGLLPGLPHFARVNALVGGFWYPSNMAAFVTMACSPSGSNAPGADNLKLQSQSCIEGGRVRVNVGWTAYSAGSQWVDLSLFNNGFAGGTFIGLGPLPPSQSQQAWDGLLANVPHYMRVNTLTADGWFPSNRLAFTTPSCPDGFTTAAKTVNATTNVQVTLTNVAFGAHPDEGYDRVVFTFSGGIPSATLQYSGQALACGSGNPVPLQGTGILRVRFANSVAHDNNGQVTVNATQLSGSPEAILEAKQTCDFEGVVEWAVGTDSVAPFRVLTLSSPSRVVIDVRR